MNFTWWSLRAPYLYSVAWVNAPVTMEAVVIEKGNNEVVSTFLVHGTAAK